MYINKEFSPNKWTKEESEFIIECFKNNFDKNENFIKLKHILMLKGIIIKNFELKKLINNVK